MGKDLEKCKISKVKKNAQYICGYLYVKGHASLSE